MPRVRQRVQAGPWLNAEDVGGSSARFFTYQVEVTAVAPTLISNTVEATSDGPDAYLVATADLPVTYRLYLPLLRK